MKSLTSAILLFAAATTANATVIDFTSTPTGSQANGYTLSGVQFFDTMGSDINVQDYGHQSDGNALGVFSDDVSLLKMVFAGVSNNLSLDFGNDDSGWTNPGDLAMLTLFLNGNVVGSTTVAMNRDDVMNQTIGVWGVNFDEALFGYVDASFNAIGLIEIVDNITFDAGQVNVPESGSIALLLVGLLGLGLSRRRLKA